MSGSAADLAAKARAIADDIDKLPMLPRGVGSLATAVAVLSDAVLALAAEDEHGK